LHRVRTDLQQVCDEILIEVRAAHPGVAVGFAANGDMTGEWDRDRLAQVISNLLGNAIQHGGGGPITVTADGTADTVTFRVHNGGRPIPIAAHASVFEPLARGDSGEAQSIGLGLFIARAIVTGHGGEIVLKSSDGSGTTFEVRLPRTAVRLPMKEDVARDG
jgi:signal transduction histidine kinase